jgi:hypothetical protein
MFAKLTKKEKESIVKKLICLCMFLFVAYAAAASEENYLIGNQAFSEVKLGLGARPMALGEAFVAVADDWNALAWNPAGLAQMQGDQIGIMHDIYIEDTSLEYLAYAHGFSNSGLGVNVSMFNYGQIDKFDSVNGLPESKGEFTPALYNATVGYGAWVSDRMALGADVKFLYQTIDDQTYNTFAFDIGTLIKTSVEGLNLGMVLQNFGNSIGYAMLPISLNVGVSYLLPATFAANDKWTLLSSMDVPFRDAAYTSGHLGTEYWFANVFALRAGYKVENNADLGALNGLSAGLGLRLGIVYVDYALVSVGDLGLSHQMALAIKF